jgi:hypothetical protein
MGGGGRERTRMHTCLIGKEEGDHSENVAILRETGWSGTH